MSKPGLAPINRLMLAATRVLAEIGTPPALPLCSEICADLIEEADAVHWATPSLAETLLADAALALGDAYSTLPQAVAMLRAARDLVIAEREHPPAKPERWETRVGIMG